MNKEKVKINYIIASWEGYRLNKSLNGEYYNNVLKNHLNILNNTLNNISQITIMKPIMNINHDFYYNNDNTYYNINLNDKIKIIENENKYQSYGQYLRAVELFIDDFDYFIFIEDDYVPGTDNFDEKLLNIYEEGSYLCSKLDNYDLTNSHTHCTISNGFISKKTIAPIIKNINYYSWLHNYGKNFPQKVYSENNYQIAFSRYLLENGITLKDYSNHYIVEFFDRGNVSYFTNNPAATERIFAPIQIIVPDDRFSIN
jgi:hypothetical protein